MRIFIGFLLFALAMTGCSRAENEEPSGITIDTRSFRKVGAQSLPPENETCYAVDFQWPRMEPPPSPVGSCYGALGKSVGFVKGGELIEISVPQGSQRSLRVLLYRRAADAPCPDLRATLEDGPSLAKTYQLAHLTNLELHKQVENVEVAVSFSGTSSSLASGAACTGGGGSGAIASWRRMRTVVASGATADTDLKLKVKVLSTGVIR